MVVVVVELFARSSEVLFLWFQFVDSNEITCHVMRCTVMLSRHGFDQLIHNIGPAPCLVKGLSLIFIRFV
jgi:hypothetical protein